MRLTAAIAALTCLLATAVSPAQDSRLPDIGSSANEVLNPAKQAEYGSMLLSQLRHYDYVLDDPLIDDWLQSVGHRLAAASDRPDHPFVFFMLKERQFNAFATLGGYIGTNAGLVLVAESEDEVAGVLAHEVAHVTQTHVLRSAERAQKDSVPILLAMLGAIAVAQAAGGNSADDASIAAVSSLQGLMAQRQIDYTRSNESEADRLGIQTLVRAGYDANAMTAMFGRMQTLSRVNQGGERERTPDYLRTHPVTTTRISEARSRAAELSKRAPDFVPGSAITSENPLIPASLRVAGGQRKAESPHFGWARERIRVLSANTPVEAIREYERMRQSRPLTAAQRYGLAIARARNGEYAASARELAPLLETHPDDAWIVVGIAEAEARNGQIAAADKRMEGLLARMPGHRAVALSYARLLAERNDPDAGRRAQAVLRPLSVSAKDDPIFQQTFARASEVAGDPIRAGEAHAEAEYIKGRPERALVQLNTLLKREDMDYYARARIEARIASITPRVLELRRQGVRDEELRRR
ncbi:MAG TPA: M48 family metalloprotease [Xanthomonadaceae bacterium]|jgi:beta-barrel assembly-enhancing protease